jgi:sortase B
MKKARKVMVVILAIVFAVSLGHLIRNAVNYRAGADNYSSAQEIAGITETPEEQPEVKEEEVVDPLVKALRSVDLAALQAVNDDIMGWILIPDTVISYPVLQGDDNDLYLNHTWNLKSNSVGAIFMDYRNSRDLSDFNTVIYGHNMRDDSMFGELHLFRTPEFFASHPSVYLVDENGCHKYDIFAAYEVSLVTAEPYQMEFSGAEDQQAYIKKCLSLSGGDTEITPTEEDKILTLSTCSTWGYKYRWVVQAVLDPDFVPELPEEPTE